MPETASRNAASMSAVAFAALSRTLEGSRTTRRVAAGATVCTISKSETSSGVACHGEAAPARAVTTWIRAAGSPNSLSKASRSWRISVAAGGSLLPGDVLGDGTGETTVTVSPRPSIPRSSKGWTPYATRYWCRPRQGARPPPGAGGTPGRAGRQLLTVPDGARPVGTVVATVAAGPAAVADPKVTAGPGLAGLDTKVAAPRAGAAAELPELPEHPASAKAAAATRTASPPAGLLEARCRTGRLPRPVPGGNIRRGLRRPPASSFIVCSSPASSSYPGLPCPRCCCQCSGAFLVACHLLRLPTENAGDSRTKRKVIARSQL